MLSLVASYSLSTEAQGVATVLHSVYQLNFPLLLVILFWHFIIVLYTYVSVQAISILTKSTNYMITTVNKKP